MVQQGIPKVDETKRKVDEENVASGKRASLVCVLQIFVCVWMACTQRTTREGVVPV